MNETKNQVIVGTNGVAEDKVLTNVLSIDQGRIQQHLDTMVRSTVEETLNAFLDAEADRLCGAKRYERMEEGADTPAGIMGEGRGGAEKVIQAVFESGCCFLDSMLTFFRKRV